MYQLSNNDRSQRRGLNVCIKESAIVSSEGLEKMFFVNKAYVVDIGHSLQGHFGHTCNRVHPCSSTSNGEA
jgi:hypothetical protein